MVNYYHYHIFSNKCHTITLLNSQCRILPFHKRMLGLERVKQLMLTAAKMAWQFWWNIAGKSKVGKVFDGEMLIRTLPITLLQIFCQIILNFKVIALSIIDPDDTLLNSQCRILSFHKRRLGFERVKPSLELHLTFYFWRIIPLSSSLLRGRKITPE